MSLPAESEIIVAGKPLDSLDRGRLGVVEPSMKFVQNTGVLTAKALVDPKSGNIPLRLANFSKEPIMVNKDMVTAVLQPVESEGSESDHASRVCQTSKTSRVLTKLSEHLVSLFERYSENLDRSQKTRLEQFLVKHQDIFSKSSSDIGHATLIQNHIDVQNAKQVKKIPYRIPWLKEMLLSKKFSKYPPMA